jgi:enoyl-CoA hydratase
MMSDLIVESANQILTLTLNRPRVMNALTKEMVREMKRVLHDAARDAQTRVVILRGAGDHFCSGADIRVEKNCAFVEYREFVSDIQDITRALQNLDAVSIAAIQGYCLGGGMEIACACDLRVAAADAHLGFPEVGIGLTITSGAAHLLPRLVGMTRAKELMLTGDAIDANTANGMGLVNRVVAREALAATASQLAEKIKARAPLAVATQKHLLDASADASLDAALRMEVDAILTTFASHDGQEGMSAWIEKRAPVFVGR